MKATNTRPGYARSMAQRLDRRKFGRAVGLGLIAAPFLRFLRSEPAAAAPSSAKRVVFIVGGGTSVNDWRMTGSSDELLVTNAWNDGLERVKDKVVVLENLNAGTGGHGSFHALLPKGTNWGGTSIDRVIANHLNDSGVTTSIPSLLLGSDVDDDQSYFRDSGSAPTINSPSAALDLVFGGVDPAAKVDEAELAAALARRQSMLDTVREDLNELHALLGAEERPKLDAHLDSIRQYEMRLTSEAPSGEGCAAPAIADSDNKIAVAQAHMALARATVACDISRVVGVSWGQHNRFAIDIPEIGVVNDMHSLHHNANVFDQLQKYESWFSNQFADFVESLESIPDPQSGGTLLDSTLVCWVRGMGDAINHTSVDSRLVFAGGPSILRTASSGRYVDAGGIEYKRGIACMAQAMGLTDPEVVDGFVPVDGVLA